MCQAPQGRAASPTGFLPSLSIKGKDVLPSTSKPQEPVSQGMMHHSPTLCCSCFGTFDVSSRPAALVRAVLISSLHTHLPLKAGGSNHFPSQQAKHLLLCSYTLCSHTLLLFLLSFLPKSRIMREPAHILLLSGTDTRHFKCNPP